MFESASGLLSKIRLGEDSYLELKEVRVAGTRVSDPHRDAMADELAAFANASGGLCVLGVDDKSREVVGIAPENLDTVENWIQAICMDAIKPPLLPLIERRTLPSSLGQELPVITVEISRSLWVHKSPGGYFHRVGSSKREMSPDYLARLFQQRSQTRLIRFDEQIVPGASIADLEDKLWRRFAPRQTDTEQPEAVLDKLGLARADESETWRPTVSGILLATNEPRRFLPNAFIQAVAYRGNSAVPQTEADAYQTAAKDISGPIDAQVFEALRFVFSNMHTEATKDAGRHDLPQYDLTAVFEALVNAVAHRDYAIYGAKIRLRLFADRLELYVPGALPNTMTIESLPLRQSARNEVLTSLLARCPLPGAVPDFYSERTHMMDKRGEGVPIILQRTFALAGKPARYEMIDGEELLLILPAATLTGGPAVGVQ